MNIRERGGEKMGGVRVALLGAGDWSRRCHLPSLKRLAADGELSLVGLWNQNDEVARLAARQFGVARVFASVDEILAEREIDAFVVIVNSRAVSDLVMRLLPRALPIFTEKPPGRTYHEASLLAERVDVPNVVAFNRRYMPLHRRFRDLVGELGGLLYAEGHFARCARPVERFVSETGVHAINFMEFIGGSLLPSPVQRIARADGSTAGWNAALRFTSGLQGALTLLPSCGASVERYAVHGADTSLYLFSPQPYTSDHPGRIEAHRGGRVVDTLYDESGDALQSAGLLNEYRDFLDAVRDGAPTASNFANACNALRIAEQIEAAPSHEEAAAGERTGRDLQCGTAEHQESARKK